MTRLIDDYLQRVGEGLRVDRPRKQQILDELRGHLEEKAREVQAAQPDLPREEVERRVLADFGNPHDLALAYEPEGVAVLTNAAGVVVLRLGEAVGRGARVVGRGTGRLLKGVAIALAFLLVLGIGLGIWAFYEVRPLALAIAEEAQPVYSYHESCPETPCNGSAGADVFYVKPEAARVRLDIDVGSAWHPRGAERLPAQGNVTVTVTDPAGEVRLDRTFSLSNGTHASHEAVWAATAGNWTIAYRFEAFRGQVDLETYVHRDGLGGLAQAIT